VFLGEDTHGRIGGKARIGDDQPRRRPKSGALARRGNASCTNTAPDISCGGCMGDPTWVALLGVLGCWLHPA
jgi:hypothetical protein